MRRMQTFAYIDGYNLYHAIGDLSESRNANGGMVSRSDKHFLKWLDLQKLANRYCGGGVSEKIYYFSASPSHLSAGKIKRHATYVRALQHRGIVYVEGQFKRTGNRWVKAGENFINKTSYEEKESDVNLAIHLVRDALTRAMQRALIITNDSDIAPAIRMAKQHNPDLKIRVITPPLQTGAVVNLDLLQAAGQVKKNRQGQVFRETKIISEDILLQCLLPEQLIVSSGDIIRRPDKYGIPDKYL